MHPSPRSPGTQSSLSQLCHHRLNAYAMAAGAAGVAMLSATLPADAKVIYTPANVNIAPHHQVSLDLNHDGIADFVIRNNVFQTEDVGGHTLLAKPLVKNNAVAGVKGLIFTYLASAFQSGAAIGPSQQFLGKVMAASGTEYGYLGQWQNVTNRYLGLKFFVAGKEHFGWARLTVSSGSGTISATLTGYAYETEVGKPIVAGSTTSAEEIRTVDSAFTRTPAHIQPVLGLLAAGAPALPIWRREPS